MAIELSINNILNNIACIIEVFSLFILLYLQGVVKEKTASGKTNRKLCNLVLDNILRMRNISDKYNIYER